MYLRKIAETVAGGWLVYNIATILITNLVTGTSISDQLMQSTLPIIFAASASLLVLRLVHRGV